jgi:hypothetical protein
MVIKKGGEIMAGKSQIGGKSHKGRQHVAHERKYKKQADRTRRNKEKAWKKHLANHPKDGVAKAAIQRLMGTF